MAHDGVNVHEYGSVRQKIIHKMIGEPVFSMSFSRKDKAITRGDNSAVKIAPERTIDSVSLWSAKLERLPLMNS
jgi:hypothetical protein